MSGHGSGAGRLAFLPGLAWLFAPPQSLSRRPAAARLPAPRPTAPGRPPRRPPPSCGGAGPERKSVPGGSRPGSARLDASSMAAAASAGFPPGPRARCREEAGAAAVASQPPGCRCGRCCSRASQTRPASPRGGRWYWGRHPLRGWRRIARARTLGAAAADGRERRNPSPESVESPTPRSPFQPDPRATFGLGMHRGLCQLHPTAPLPGGLRSLAGGPETRQWRVMEDVAAKHSQNRLIFPKNDPNNKVAHHLAAPTLFPTHDSP